MLQAAKRRLQPFTNVDLRRGDLEGLPIDDGQLDLATLMLVLHHVSEPQKALAEVARALKPGARTVIVDMRSHERENYRQQMGHVWLGFSDAQIEHLLRDHNFSDITITSLPTDPRAKGPELFVATASRGRSSTDN
jgi:ubiquinone/menaquinone biosynthesis C-methylase UbiE